MNYKTDKGADKEVVLFLAKKIGGDIKPQESEVSVIEWLDFDEAIKKISYENTKELFRKVLVDNNLA